MDLHIHLHIHIHIHIYTCLYISTFYTQGSVTLWESWVGALGKKVILRLLAFV